MRGYLSLANQQILDPAAIQPVHRHRASLLDLGSRDMEDEGEAMDVAQDSLKEAKQQFGTIKEKIRSQPFQASQQSLYERMNEIGDFTNNAYYRSAVKNGIRDTNKHTHEWLPCQLMADCLRRDLIIGLNPGPWLLLQVHLRTATSGLIFDPGLVQVVMDAKDRAAVGHNLRQATDFGLSKLYKDQLGQWQADALQPGDRCYVLQGHEGAMKAGTDLHNYKPDALDTKGWLSYGSSEFHSQLLYCFDRYELEDIPGAMGQRSGWVRQKTQAFLQDMASIATRWMWDPNSVPPGSVGFALPFKGYIGKGKERKEVLVDTSNYVEWLAYCVETRHDTLQMLQICRGALGNIYT